MYKKLLLLFLVSLLLSLPVFAGGGRFIIKADNNIAVVGDTIPVYAIIYTSGAMNDLDVGERAEFRLVIPHEGSCTTTQNTTGKDGKIYGHCTYSKAGQLAIYVQSLDNGDKSSYYFLHFTEKPSVPPTPTPLSIIKSSPLLVPSQIPSPSLETTPSAYPPLTEPTPPSTFSLLLMPFMGSFGVLGMIYMVYFLKPRKKNRKK